MNAYIKPVLLLGGFADGQVHSVDVRRQRAIDIEHATYLGMTTSVSSRYTIHTLVDVAGSHYVGMQDMNECAVRMLIECYRRVPPMHPIGPPPNGVVLIGGDSDGRRILVPLEHDRCVGTREGVSRYHIIRVEGKDGKPYRVGVLDAVSVDPIKELIAGYRKPQGEKA